MLQFILSGQNESANQDAIDKRGLENVNFAKIETRQVKDFTVTLSLFLCDDTKINRAILEDWQREDRGQKSFPGKLLAWGEV